ncbi:AGC protein kinase [Edhazardia aedis USNM 41457]|uniref:AGC protein kinase n=1 Tax=Edhazardia aedis (strain USNM 41457) TaxID=1003232 RepID=J9DBJ4_EDHAE|nr:AGC protein kinase [Edhazardia aedis USNM 41457]|eukprot:EJW05091.1 AGC protein kinase [Edhazardia aedis USNM 41457]
MFTKNDFDILDKINDGPFWETYVVKTTGHTKTIKKFFEIRVMQKQKVVNFEEEVRVVKEVFERSRLRHIYICNIVDVFQDYDNCYLVGDLPCGGYLYFYLRRCGVFSDEISRFFIAQIISAVQYLHKRKIIYRFLSPENIMITGNGHIKLRMDFMNKIGMIQEKFEENIAYVPVDYLREGKLTNASDYWSIGLILYEFLFGRTPFDGRNPQETLENIMQKRVAFPKFVDPKAENLLIRLLDKYDFRRLGFDKKDRMLIREHPFFEDLNWEGIEANKIDSPLFLEPIRMFEKPGKKMDVLFRSNHKEGHVDGYGALFSCFGKNEKITHSEDI